MGKVVTLLLFEFDTADGKHMEELKVLPVDENDLNKIEVGVSEKIQSSSDGCVNVIDTTLKEMGYVFKNFRVGGLTTISDFKKIVLTNK